MDYVMDVFVFLGLILLGVGLYMMQPYLMFMVIGSILFLIGLYGAKHTPKEQGERKGGD